VVGGGSAVVGGDGRVCGVVMTGFLEEVVGVGVVTGTVAGTVVAGAVLNPNVGRRPVSEMYDARGINARSGGVN
jgi:hypothetical protein